MSNCRSFATANQSHLDVNRTGLKVYGKGEWKVRQHGYSKRRTWRKVKLALNAHTGQVHAALMTNQNVADGDALAKLLDQIPREEQIDVIGGDGAYDTKPCHGGHCCTQCYSVDSDTRGCRSLASGYAQCSVV